VGSGEWYRGNLLPLHSDKNNQTLRFVPAIAGDFRPPPQPPFGTDSIFFPFNPMEGEGCEQRLLRQASYMGALVHFPRIELPPGTVDRGLRWCERPGLIHTAHAFRTDKFEIVSIMLCGREAPIASIQFPPEKKVGEMTCPACRRAFVKRYLKGEGSVA